MSKINRSKVGIATHLLPNGPLNAASAVRELQEGIESCLESNEIHLILDLSSVPLLNSEALEVLLDAQSQLLGVGGGLKVGNANAVIQDVFRITGVSDQIPSIETATPDEPSDPAPRSRGGGKIGEILLEKGLVTEAQIEEALDLQQRGGDRMAQVLVQKGWLPEKDLLEALSEQLSVPFLWLRQGVFDPALASLIDREIALRLKVMPLFQVRGVLYLATAEPQSVPSLDAVEDITGLKVRPVIACTNEILQTLTASQDSEADLSEYIGDLEGDLELVENRLDDDHAAIDELAAGSPVINLINGIIQRAVTDGASDIHIEPTRTKSWVRLRVDGVLYPIMSPPIDVHPALVSRLKVMANLDIAERRLPQDGRIQVMTRGRTVDLRFSSLPGIFGEKVVLRVLDKSQAILELDRLGLTEDNQERFKSLLGKGYGLLLVTGPTGSGKTTTLYAGINHLRSSEKNIVTIEDPVEYQIDGISQNQIKESIGLGFAKILKHALRQDPDIIMVGEIREAETAEVAVQAALTGHLVLSTLHTNDSIGAVTRLVDMGVEPYLLSSALVGVMAQRLIRMVCAECKTSYAVQGETLERFGVKTKETVRLTKGRGCGACYDSGYRGRLAIHEIVETTPELQTLIVSNPTRSDLDAYVRQHELRTLADDGMARVLEGRTALEEVFRVLNS
jgi:type IV pilus assembly protein PilB